MAQGGKSLNDRHLAARVRSKLLVLAEKILDGEDEKAKIDLLNKMCTGLLPRLNEHSGEDGSPITIAFDKSFEDYGTPLSTKRDSDVQEEV